MTGIVNIGFLDQATLDLDEHGYTLLLEGDLGAARVRIPGTREARMLLDALAALVDWVAEEDAHRAEYEAASPEERARVRGVQADSPDDGVHVTDWSVRADRLREQRRECVLFEQAVALAEQCWPVTRAAKDAMLAATIGMRPKDGR